MKKAVTQTSQPKSSEQNGRRRSANSPYSALRSKRRAVKMPNFDKILSTSPLSKAEGDLVLREYFQGE